MKKAYKAPVLYAEDYTLMEHISQSCAYQTNFGTGCPINEAGVVFFTTVDSCSEDGVSMIQFAGLDPLTATVEDLINTINPTCYNAFSDFHQLFTS